VITLPGRTAPLAAAALLLLLAAAPSPLSAQRGNRGGGGPAGGDTAATVAKTEVEKRVLATLNEISRPEELYANVPAADGRMLRILAEAVNAKQVVEIGTSTGLSGMWFCMALERTGGKLITHDIDAGRLEQARAHFKKAGVDHLVTIVEGDAHKTIAKLKGPVDVVFIDAEKEGYVDYLKQTLPLVRPGGLILAHNTGMVRDYMQTVAANPDLETVVFSGGAGLAISVKKR
jgi:predicted O-methyltransferase YrrM